MALKSPLGELEAATGGVFFEHQSREIVDHFGDVRREYDATAGTVAAYDLSYAGRLRLTGRDRVRYLHNMTSNDIKGLKIGAGCYAALLTHQGRMESDLHVYALQHALLVEFPSAGIEKAHGTLQKYIVADDVKIENEEESLCILSLQGPSAGEAMERTLGIPVRNLGLLEHRVIGRPSADWLVVHRDRSGCDGYDLWLPTGEAEGVWRQWIEGEKIQPAGYCALNMLRTEAGIPWYGADMDDKNLPMEMGLSSAISLNKGCYRGQEIVARVHYRGRLDRKFGAVAVQSELPPARGSEIRAQGGKIGEVTSAIRSPRLGRSLALGILKSDFLQPGTPVEVVIGESNCRAEVISLPVR